MRLLDLLLLAMFVASSQNTIVCGPFQHMDKALKRCINCSSLCSVDASPGQKLICKDDSHCQDYLASITTTTDSTTTVLPPSSGEPTALREATIVCGPFQHVDKALDRCINCSILCAEDAHPGRKVICKDDSRCQDYLASITTTTATPFVLLPSSEGPTAVPTTSQAGHLPPSVLAAVIALTVVVAVVIFVALIMSQWRKRCKRRDRHEDEEARLRDVCRNGEGVKLSTEETVGPDEQANEDSGIDSHASSMLVPQEADREVSSSNDEDEMTLKMLA